MKIYYKLFIISVLFFYTSCSDGIFNFTKETGTLNLFFNFDSSVSQEIDKTEIELKNIDTGDFLKKSYNSFDSEASSSDTIYRIDSGSWEYKATAYGNSNNSIGTFSGDFNLVDGGINTLSVFYTAESEFFVEAIENSNSDIIYNDMITFFTVQHTAGENIENINPSVNITINGNCFKNYLTYIKIDFPDSLSWESSFYDTTNLYNEDFEYNDISINFRRKNYFKSGTYTVTLTDKAHVEISKSDYCRYIFSSEGGFATLGGNYGKTGVLTTANYSLNGADSDSCLILYASSVQTPTKTFSGSSKGVFSVVSSTSTSIEAPFFNNIPSGSGECYIVLATVNKPVTDEELEAAYQNYSYADMSPEGFVDWMIKNFSENLNFIGVSSEKVIY